MRRRNRLLLAAFAFVVVIVAVTSTLALVGGRSATTSPSTTAAPNPLDVAAARACQAWNNYLGAALGGRVTQTQGEALLSAAEPLIAGSAQDEAAGRALPKWEALGAYIIDGADDVVNGDTEALQSDGAAVAAQCKTVPAAAAVVGGFVASS